VSDYDYGVSQTVALGAGDILFLATDGLIECPTAGLGLFGFDRVLEIVRLNRERSAPDIIGALFAAAQPLLLQESHTERIQRPTVVGENAFHKMDECCSDIPIMPDDMTAVVIKVK
jgi:hypothetical protein